MFTQGSRGQTESRVVHLKEKVTMVGRVLDLVVRRPLVAFRKADLMLCGI